MLYDPVLSELKQYVAAVRNIGGGKMIGAWAAQELVIRRGRSFAGCPLPGRYLRGVPKQCFNNTRRLVIRCPSLTYYEGYVSSEKLPIAIHHAWAVDRAGKVIDVTLPCLDGTYYRGIAINKETLARFSESGSILIDRAECINMPFLNDCYPSFAADLEALLRA